LEDLDRQIGFNEKGNWWIGIICSRPRPMVGFCKYDKESVGFVKCIEFCD